MRDKIENRILALTSTAHLKEAAALVLVFCLAYGAAFAAPLDENLPMVGTDAHGHAYPGAVVPFGMVQSSNNRPII